MGTSAIVLALAGCAAPVPEVGEPLVRPGERLDVLAEARMLELPPAVTANRFLLGWWPRKGADGVELVVGAGSVATVEVVTVESRARTLVVDLAAAAASGGAEGEDPELVVRAGGQELARAAVPADGGAVELAVPPLPIGRAVLELALDGPAGAEVVVRGVAWRDARAAGDARVDGDVVVQTGSSIVELVRTVRPGDRLVGIALPSARLGVGQRLTVEVAVVAGDGDEDGGASRGEWSIEGGRGVLAGLRDLFGGEGAAIDLALAPAAAAGPLTARVRLLAAGDGVSARWQLRLVGGEAAGRTPGAEPVPAAVVPSVPPRRVVVVVLDAWRADHAGFAGDPRGLTPNLDALAGDSLVADAHAAVAPNTLPSTKALFTGHVWRDNGGWKLDPEGPPTLAERFAAAGYATGLFSGNVYVSADWGMDRGFAHAAPEVLIEGYSERSPPPYNDNAERVVAAAVDWLGGLPSDQRAFAYLHAICPHNPYDPPPPYRERFLPPQAATSTIDGSTDTLLAIKHGRLDPTAADVARIRGLYAGAVASCDAALAPLLAALRAADPEGRDTVLAVTSDHGEELFEHGGVLHGYTLYEEMLRIPLLVWGPGRVPAGRVEAMTTTLDLHATLLALLGRQAGEGEDGVDGGRNLLPLAATTALDAHRFAAASNVKGGIFAVRDERFKVILAPRTGLGWGQGEGRGRTREPEYVFDLAVDPAETHNLAGSPEPAARRARLALLAWIERGLAATPGGSEAAPDAAAQDRLRALGYLD